MSPTSYQAAPPRVDSLNLDPGVSKSRSIELAPPCSSGLRRRVLWLGESIEKLLVAAHHAELLARDPLLNLGVREHRLLDAFERVDFTPQRVDRRTQA